MAVWAVSAPLSATAAQVTVELAGGREVTSVGAIARWDKDGNARRVPDPKAKIDAPAVDAEAADAGGGRWVFKDLPRGKYDLVILAKDRVRIEGFQYVPVREFDPFFPRDATTDDETRESIVGQIRKSPHYENKVEPLYLGGDKKAVRVLVMLIRDKPTSYESESPGAATIRHEIWQFSWNYGGWQKEKRTKVLDRVLLPRQELRQWTWLWDPKLGGIEVEDQAAKDQVRDAQAVGREAAEGAVSALTVRQNQSRGQFQRHFIPAPAGRPGARNSPAADSRRRSGSTRGGIAGRRPADSGAGSP